MNWAGSLYPYKDDHTGPEGPYKTRLPSFCITNWVAPVRAVPVTQLTRRPALRTSAPLRTEADVTFCPYVPLAHVAPLGPYTTKFPSVCKMAR
jgi:hypothetical protein